MVLYLTCSLSAAYRAADRKGWLFMENVKDFLKRKDIVISPQRYLIEALGAMAQGLFASLLIGTIIKTLGQQTGLEMLVDLGGYATAMSGPAMACAIGWALHCPPLVLFSLITVGYSANALGGAGGPLAVLLIAIVAAELGKAVSKETKVDILVTPLVTIFVGVGLSMLIAAPIGAAASQVVQLGQALMQQAITTLTTTVGSTTAKAGSALAYSDLATLYGKFSTYDMNLLLVSPKNAAAIFAMSEMEDVVPVEQGQVRLPFGTILCKVPQMSDS